MELLIAFLMSFGVISADDAKHIKSSDEIKEIMMKSDLKDDLKKDFIIWGAEADDF
jgi:hypothetical protein